MGGELPPPLMKAVWLSGLEVFFKTGAFWLVKSSFSGLRHRTLRCKIERSGLKGLKTGVASQAAWYRMENGPKSQKWENIGQKIENGSRPEIGKKWPKNGEKIEK